MRSEIRRFLLISSAAMAMSFSASADTLFQNTTGDLTNRFSPGLFEVGDQIHLTHVGFITNFSFEFYGLSSGLTFAGPVEAQVKIYLMDGPLFNGENSPGTLLYTSGFSAIPGPTERSTFIYTAGADFPAQGLLISSTNITWSLQFRGMGTGDELGVDLYSPPTVGQDFPDYWRNTGVGLNPWVLETNAVAVDFAAQFQGTIPEPSVFALGVVGGLVMLVSGRKRKA